MPITSPVVAIVTPFDACGDVDEAALRDYLQFMSGHGLCDLVVNGTTGEFASLTLPERMRVIEICRKSFPGRLINHVSACAYRDCLTLLEHSADHADAVLLLPPFYYAGIDEQGCLLFMQRVLESCRLPAYLYNFPRHTQFQISPGLLAALAGEFKCVAGIKDSGGDLAGSERYKRACPRRQVLVGNDRQVLTVLRRGLDGSITGAGNPVPEFLVQVQRGFTAGDLSAAQAAQERLDQWTTFRESIPLCDIAISKAALGIRIPGYPPHVRPPLVTAGQEVLARLRSAFIAAGNGFRSQ